MNTVSIMPSVQFSARKKASASMLKKTETPKPVTESEKKLPCHIHASQVLNEVFPYIAGLEGNAIPRNSNCDVLLNINPARLADFCTMLESLSEGKYTLTKGTIAGKYIFRDHQQDERLDVVIAKTGGYSKPRQPETNFPSAGRVSKPRPIRQGDGFSGPYHAN